MIAHTELHLFLHGRVTRQEASLLGKGTRVVDALPPDIRRRGDDGAAATPS